jgi:O-antigen/teichoic acid export membrane protein
MGVIKQQTIKGTFYSYLGILIGFITLNVLQPHILTAEQIGLTGILVSLSLLFAQFASLGFGGTARYFPYFRNAERKHHGYLFLYCMVSAVGMLFVIIFVYLFKNEIIKEKLQKSLLFERYFWYLIPLTLFTLFFNVFDLYARVLFNAISGRVLREFTKRLFILIAVMLIYFKLVNFNIYMVVWLLANVIPTFIIVAILIRDGHFFFKPDFKFLDKDLIRKLTSISFYFILSGSAGVLVDNIDKYIIKDNLGLNATGVYTIAYYFATVISLPARSLYSIATTVVSESWKTNDTENIRVIYKKSCINQLITALFLLIIIWANVDSIFHYLPSDYASGKYVIFFVGLGYLIDSATGINSVIIAASKYFRYDLWFNLVLIAVSVITNLLLIPRYGITGTAIATALTFFIFNLIRYLFILKVFKMQPFTLKSPITLLVGLSVYFASRWLIPQNSNVIVDLLCRSLFITVIFGLATYFLNLSEDINDMIDGFLIKFKIKG